MNLALSSWRRGRFQINAFRRRGSVGLVIRRVDLPVASFEELGLPQSLLSLSIEKRGLIIVVGSRGAGKYTTLAAIIDYRNQHDAAHILTVEDPIEILHSHHKSLVHRREVGFDTDSFQSVLQNAMRQAPDAILISEIPERVSSLRLEFFCNGRRCP